MALNRDKFRKIVGGITTAETPETVTPSQAETEAATVSPPVEAEQGGAPASASTGAGKAEQSADHRRFAKRGRPKGRKDDTAGDKTRKVKVSLFLSEVLVNDLYDWAHADRIHPGEMFERALKPFHEREAKRRNAGKG